MVGGGGGILEFAICNIWGFTVKKTQTKGEEIVEYLRVIG